MLELGTSWGYWVQPFYDVKCRNHQKSTERPIGPSLRRIPLLPPTTSSWPSSLESKRVAFLSPSPCVLVPRRIPNVKGKGLCGTWFTNVFRKGCFQPTDDLRFFCCTSRGSTDAGRGLDKDDMFHIVFVRQNLCFCWCLPRMGLRSMYRIRMISHAYHI